MEWKKGQHLLKASEKYKMSQEDLVVKLEIQDVDLEDAAEYSCICGDQKTTAVLSVHGKANQTSGDLTLLLSAPACVCLFVKYCQATSWLIIYMISVAGLSFCCLLGEAYHSVTVHFNGVPVRYILRGKKYLVCLLLGPDNLDVNNTLSSSAL